MGGGVNYFGKRMVFEAKGKKKTCTSKNVISLFRKHVAKQENSFWPCNDEEMLAFQVRKI